MLKRFNVLNSENDQALEGIDYPVLLNLNQIASIKCINIMYKGNIIQGFWIRMVSGKKYKATRVPRDIKALLDGEGDMTEIEINGTKFSGNFDPSEISLQ
ncbi:unnamed protein product [Chrysoparadoxa australica]